MWQNSGFNSLMQQQLVWIKLKEKNDEEVVTAVDVVAGLTDKEKKCFKINNNVINVKSKEKVCIN